MVPLDDYREPVFNTPEHQNLYAEVMALPAKYRLPLYLYYYEGYTAAEVGELLGLGPSTVRTRLARAREKLKAQLRRSEPCRTSIGRHLSRSMPPSSCERR